MVSLKLAFSFATVFGRAVLGGSRTSSNRKKAKTTPGMPTIKLHFASRRCLQSNRQQSSRKRYLDRCPWVKWRLRCRAAPQGSSRLSSNAKVAIRLPHRDPHPSVPIAVGCSSAPCLIRLS